jgi:hypothetical protein
MADQNNQPNPASSSSQAVFTIFPNFAPELRMKIWELSLPDPSIFAISEYQAGLEPLHPFSNPQYYYTQVPGREVGNSYLPIINRESRYETDRECLRLRSRHPWGGYLENIYFFGSRDIMYFREANGSDPRFHRLNIDLLLELLIVPGIPIIDKVGTLKKLAVSADVWLDWENPAADLLRLRLEELLITGFPHDSFEPYSRFVEAKKGGLPGNQNQLRQRALAKVYLVLYQLTNSPHENWQIPVIRLGSFE